MGVRGLKSFVKKFFKKWECREVRGELVVDGSNLCHELYRVNWTHGGQYSEYRLQIREYFHTLQQADIYPIVVFDGIDYKQEKTEETFRRRSDRIREIDSGLTSTCEPKDERISILPVFAIEVFKQTLHELEVPLCVADGEADAMIVQIANHYSCPVLSSDSDFFLFNVESGYILLDFFDCDTTDATPVTAKVFTVKAFAEQFRFADENLCFIIPAIIGNDFLTPVPSNFLQYVQKKAGHESSTIMAIIKFASQFESMESFVEQIASIPPCRV